MRKWKVLIADDEAIIREGIREAVRWEEQGMEVAAEAEDGEEALELALRHKIDLLLVDLNMPIMNGIELMKEIRKTLPDCKIVVITGHDEFGYAQESIRLQVSDYLLKPVNPVQLGELIGKLRIELESEEKQRRHMELASRQMQKNYPLLRERFFLEWIGDGLTEGEIVEQLRFLKLPEAPPDKLIAVRWPELIANEPLTGERDRQLMLFAIENIAGEWLEPFERVIFRDQAGLIVICVWGTVPDELLSRIENSVQQYLKLSVYVHAEPVSGGLSALSDAYRACKAEVFKESRLSPIVRRARQALRERFADPEITLEKLALELKVSPVYLSRMIKQELGVSFVALLTRMRIKKAIELLGATDMPIHEIAASVGYESQHYFSTAFKKTVGVSPNQYRRGAAFAD